MLLQMNQGLAIWQLLAKRTHQVDFCQLELYCKPVRKEPTRECSQSSVSLSRKDYRVLSGWQLISQHVELCFGVSMHSMQRWLYIYIYTLIVQKMEDKLHLRWRFQYYNENTMRKFMLRSLEGSSGTFKSSDTVSVSFLVFTFWPCKNYLRQASIVIFNNTNQLQSTLRYIIK